MPRPPETPGKPRKDRITLRFTSEGIAALDRARGSLSRSAFIRAAVADAVRRTR